eukprot:tig00000114_g6041.t1
MRPGLPDRPSDGADGGPDDGDGEADAATRAVPRDVLAAMLVLLDGPLDRMRAAAVCRRWRSVVREAPPPARLVLTVAGDVLEGAAFRGELRRRLAALRGELGRGHLPSYEAELRAEAAELEHAARDAVSARDAAEILARPAWAGARSLALRCVAGGTPLDLDGLHLWRALAAAPESLEALDVLLPREPPLARSGLEHVTSALRLNKAPFADGLRELSVRYRRPLSPPVFARVDDPKLLPAMKSLECLGAVLQARALAGALGRAPRLRLAHTLELPSEADVRAAAAAGLRCRALLTSYPSEAAFSLLAPAAFAGVHWALAPSLTLVSCEPLPLEMEGGTDAPPLAGLAEITLEGCPLRPAALRSLAGVASLRELWLRRCPIRGSRPGSSAPSAPASPADVAGALAALPGRCAVRVWPGPAWSAPEAAAFLDAALLYPPLVRALDVPRERLPASATVDPPFERLAAARAALQQLR